MDVPPKTAPRLFLIDAYALIYRAFFAFINRPLTNAQGENTSAPFGFANFLIDIRERYQPDYLAVVFDAGNSHREKEYPEYKATREKMPDELRASLPRIRTMVDGFNDALVELEGYEADDVIGTLAVKARDAGLEAVIVSGDKDFYQLVGSGIHLLNPGRGGRNGVAAEWVDESNVHERFGIPAESVIDYLALIGDSSDNIPGAPGIGPKTAVALLEQYGSLDEILVHASELKQKRPRKALTEHVDQVLLSRRLVTIMKDLDVDLDLDALTVREPDREKLHPLFVELGFRRLTEKFSPMGSGGSPMAVAPPAGDDGGESSPPPAEPPPAGEYTLVTDVEGVREVVEQVRAQGWMTLETHTSFADPHRASLVGLAVGLEAGRAFYLSFGHTAPGELSLGLDSEGVRNLPSPEEEGLEDLWAVLSDPAVRKCGLDLKSDLVVLSRVGRSLAGFDFDTAVASYVLDPGRRHHDLDALAQDFLGVAPHKLVDVVGTGQKKISFAEAEPETAMEYACARVHLAQLVREQFEAKLSEHELSGLFSEVEMPLVPVLGQMELAGIRIDTEFFGEMSGKLEQDLKLIREEIYKIAGEEFNLNSTQQLREILFERQGLPVIKRTKTGASTDSSVLEELAAQGHEIPRHMLEYRELEKLRSTYVDAFPQLVNPRTGRIHTRFNQTVAATGRLSSSEPNLQNIPIRTELGRQIRKGFVPEEGNVFYGADYSQIELRILAHFSGDEAFVSAFREGIDVHKQTAAVIFGVPLEAVTSGQRGQAKTINFATLYGQGAFSLARQLGISREQAQAFIDGYFERFSGVRGYLDEQVNSARDLGYVETLLGRRRYVPELHARNHNIRQFGERIAQNTPIQGTAADLIKVAMLRVAEGLAASGSSAAMVLQVHDELLFEVPEGDAEELAIQVEAHMVGAMDLDVPLAVDGAVGRSWYETKG